MKKRPVLKSLGLLWRDGKLLCAEIPNADGTIKGVRPLGGSVEFGETTRDAVIREFQEELGINVTPKGEPTYLENIFTYLGKPGHEIIALYEVSAPDNAKLKQEIISFTEDSGEKCTARWYNVDDLDGNDGLQLFPDGLKRQLTSH